jgi:hypothetical protein
MNNLIKFYKDKITTYVYEDNGLEIGDFIETDIEKLGKPFTSYYGHAVDFDENLTVRDFVTLLNKYADIINSSFTAYNHGINIEVYYKEIFNEPEEDYSNEADFIELYWETDCIKEKDINFIADWVTFCGKIRNFKKKHLFDTPTRAMHIVPMRNWKDLPLKLNKFISYREMNAEGNSSSLKFIGVKLTLLFDLISGFLFDLTYHGTPEQQIIIANNIKSQIKNMSEGFMNKPPISFVPIGEMFSKEDVDDKKTKSKPTKRKKQSLDELNELLKSYIDNENYEKAKEIQDKIKSIKKK